MKSNSKKNRDCRVLRPKFTMKHVSHDSFENFEFGDLFDLTLTLTWAKYENFHSVRTLAWFLGVHMEIFGAKTAKFEVSMVRNLHTLSLSFDLTLTSHVTSIFNFSKCFRSVSSRSFECRLAHISKTNRFRDSKGRRIRSPSRWWVQSSPGGGG